MWLSWSLSSHLIGLIILNIPRPSFLGKAVNLCSGKQTYNSSQAHGITKYMVTSKLLPLGLERECHFLKIHQVQWSGDPVFSMQWRKIYGFITINGE